MATSFSQALTYVLRNEGGFVDDPDDRGGATNRGITLATLQGFWGRPATVLELRDLPDATIANIYFDLYWRPSGALWLTRQPTATALLDTAVLHGVRRAIRLAQAAAQVTVDGNPGPETLRAIDAMPPQDFINALVSLLGQSFGALVAADPRQSKFLPGWLARTHRLLGLYGQDTLQA